MSFFKSGYSRHTNFAKASHEFSFSGSLDFGNKVICKIPRQGDLLGRCYIKVKLPSILNEDCPNKRWMNPMVRKKDFIIISSNFLSFLFPFIPYIKISAYRYKKY